jgi:carbohydrate kinase (thermoresistant glucokinase family)
MMGVTGSGKSTVACLLADRLDWPFEEGDDLHPEANVKKMAQGHPLTDEDRWPWLARVRAWIDERVAAGEPGIITCSALKRSYRDVLRNEHVLFVYLAGTREQLLIRLRARQGHFMPVSLLDSQLADLEPPGADEQAIRIDISESAQQQAERIMAAERTRYCSP